MPGAITWQYLGFSLLVWVALRLAHNEAMRRMYAARIVFGKPYLDAGNLYSHLHNEFGKRVKSEVQYYFYAAKVDVTNEPYWGDSGRDVSGGWASVELFGLDSKPFLEWRDARWEDNKQPGYGDHPIDHYPDDQKIRKLNANGRPNILCLILKPLNDEFAYSFRGQDQINSDWRSDLKIPKGHYLLRLRIRGVGLSEAAERIYELKNLGAGNSLEFLETDRRIERYWAR